MGCDIHTYAEVLVDDIKYVHETGTRGTPDFVAGHVEKVGEHWELVTITAFPYAYFRPDEPTSPHQNGANVPYTAQPYHGRDYDLFAVLADVRNDGRGWTPLIEENRGVPEDASEGWLQFVDDWGYDLHSKSWFTLAELRQFITEGRFDQTITRTNRSVATLDYIALRDHGTLPTSWAAWATGEVTKEAFDRMTLQEQQEHLAKPWSSVSGVSWDEPHIGAERFERFFKSVESLAKFAPYAEPWQNRREPAPPCDENRVRLVFGFDN